MNSKQLKKTLADSRENFDKALAGVNIQELVIDETIHPKIADAIIQMITSYNLPYYGEFTQAINFVKADIPTCGVNVTARGMNFYWGEKFIDKLSNEEIIFIILHELFHLMFDHNKRGIGYDHKIANLAQDMIINSIIHGDMIIGEGLKHMIEIPKDEIGNNSGIFMQPDYKGHAIFEDLYVWLMDQYNKWKNENSDKIAEQKKKQQINVDKDGNYRIDDETYCSECKQIIDETKKVEVEDQDTEKEYCPKCLQEITQEDEDEDDGQDGEGENGEGENGEGETVAGENGEGENGEGENGEGENGEGQGQPGQGEGQSQQGQPGQGQGGSYSEDNGVSGENRENKVGQYKLEDFFKNVEGNGGQTLDIHFDDDVTPEVKKQIIEGQMESLKSRGFESGSVEKILQKLRKQRKDYLKEIKRSMSNMIFGTKKRKSITRLHRKGIYGLKGTRKYKTRINCLLDTSGSMGGDFERVLSYIFQNDIEINMLQVDTEIKQHIVIKKMSQLERMKIEGLGGTCLTPGLQYIAKDKELNKLNTVILTDGYTDHLDMTGVRGKVLVLSTGVECPVVENTSKLKQIIIDRDQYV